MANPQSQAHHRRGRTIALTGFMGAGKSTVGRALADHLSWKFIDLDEEIESRQRQRIREVFRTFGEERFREIEAIVLGDALDRITVDTVIALGGGTFVQPANAERLLRSGVYVTFLETPLELLFERCLTTVSPEENLRPLAADPEAFAALYESRLPLYRKAHLVVNTSEKTSEEIAREIATAVRLIEGNL